MKIGVAIPCKGESTRLPNKNLLTINGEPLVRIAVKKLIKAGCFDEIFVDTDSERIWQIVQDLDCSRMTRPENLATNATDGNGLMKWEYEAGLKDFDLVCQFHCTSPLIKPESIKQAIVNFVVDSEFDSTFTVKDSRDYYWISHVGVLRPTYDLVNIPNSFELPRHYQETHALYAIHKSVFEKLERRIGDNPLLAKVTELESYDINTEEDLRIVRTLGETLCRGGL